MTNEPLALDKNMTVGDVRILAAGGQSAVMTPFDQHALRAVDLLEMPDELPFLEAYDTAAHALAGPLSAYVLETVVRNLSDLQPSYNVAFAAMLGIMKAQNKTGFFAKLRETNAARAYIGFLNQFYQRTRGGFPADPEVMNVDLTGLIFLLGTRATQHLHAQGVPLDPKRVALCAKFVPTPPWKGSEQSEPTDPIIVAEPAITQPPKAMENETSEPETTVGPWGIATNFSRAGFVYVVSTVHRKEFGGFYQTIILKHSSADWRAGHLANRQTVYRIEVMSQLQSVQEHIDTVRMALSKSEDAWHGTKAYQDDVMNADGRRNECPQEMPWKDKSIRDIVLAADIIYKPGLFARLLSGK
jgi:hypothetical protein